MTNAEIDKAICEFMGVKPVIKWLVGPEGEDSSYMDFFSERNAKEWLNDKKREYPGSDVAKAIIRRIEIYRPFSTNVAHALEALESFGVAWELYKTDVSDYSCNIYDNQKQCFINGGYAKTKEMAICLAIIIF